MTPGSGTSARGGPASSRLSPDWILAAVFVGGLIVMLAAIGSGSTAAEGPAGPRIAVGMTPADGAITVRVEPCGSEKVETIALAAVEPSLTVWEAIAVEPQTRYVFIVGQAPTSFVETVPMIDQLPRGALLEATVTSGVARSVQFYFADLLPDLWSYDDTYYTDGDIGRAMTSNSSCPGAAAGTSSGRRTLMIVGFLVAAAAGAGLVSRRIVVPGL
ncbi:MAG TPA: hypothetical protein VLT15_08800 [Acidimicrobiia bacterium]|nr:hypothetical protein [Acidimicrobiia bacterium]